MAGFRQQLRALARRLRPAPPPPPPKPIQLYAIGMAAGPDPWRLTPAATNPVLTREDVTDARAVFVADPFLHHQQGQWHMFFEVMNWHSGRGEIGLATSADGLAWRYQQIVLAEPFHLSYPYVFAWQGDVYMVPECYQAGSVRLYRAEAFPSGWRHIATLLEGPYFADCSPFYYDGRWWMLCEVSDGFACDTLRLYTAEELTGPWREHPCSPIVSGNPLTARPAGRVLLDGGRIFRFAQACVPHYGVHVSAFEITRLTTDDYAEQAVGTAPLFEGSDIGWNSEGMHHLDAQRLPDGTWLGAVDGWRFAPPLE